MKGVVNMSSLDSNTKDNVTELISVKNVHKIFGGIHALSDVTFSLNAGEVHALVGENGAGKSTLIKIITGAYNPGRGFY